MLCKGCKYPQSQVVYTRQDDAKNITTRRRECLRCGLRFTTSEQFKEPKRPRDERTPEGNT